MKIIMDLSFFMALTPWPILPRLFHLCLKISQSHVIFTGSQVRLEKVLAPSQIAFSRENRGTDAGVLLLMAYAGRLRPTWLLTFFRLQVYERVGKSVISVGKKAQNG